MDSRYYIAFTIIAIGLVVFAKIVFFPSRKNQFIGSKSVKKAAEKKAKVDQAPSAAFIRYKNYVRRDCCERTVAEFMAFVFKYRSRKGMQGVRIVEKGLSDSEKSELKELFQTIVAPSVAVPAQVKDNFKAFLIASGVSDLDQFDNTNVQNAPGDNSSFVFNSNRDYEAEQQQRAVKAVTDELELLDHNKYRVFNNVRIPLQGQIARFDNIVVTGQKIFCLMVRPFGFALTEGGDDEAHLNITEDGKWQLRKNHTVTDLPDPSEDLVKNKELLLPFLTQLGELPIAFAVVLANPMLTYHSDSNLPFGIISINDLRNIVKDAEIEVAEEEPEANSDGVIEFTLDDFKDEKDAKPAFDARLRGRVIDRIGRACIN